MKYTLLWILDHIHFNNYMMDKNVKGRVLNNYKSIKTNDWKSTTAFVEN